MLSLKFTNEGKRPLTSLFVTALRSGGLVFDLCENAHACDVLIIIGGYTTPNCRYKHNIPSDKRSNVIIVLPFHGRKTDQREKALAQQRNLTNRDLDDEEPFKHVCIFDEDTGSWSSLATFIIAKIQTLTS